MKYLLDLKKLEPADIVLESGNTKLVSDLIKKVTNSHYSHAMLYIDHSINHATSDGGVYSKNPQRILVDDPTDLKVLRLRDRIPLMAKQQICKESSYLIGSLYGKREAALAIKNTNKPAKSRKQFCSRMVAQCYAKYGINIVNNPDYCTPEDINSSNILVEVEDCIREANEHDLIIFERRDPNIELQEETYKWLDKSRVVFKNIGIEIQTINDITAHLANDRKYDNKIVKLINETKYCDLYNVDREINTMRYSTEEMHLFLTNSDNINEKINSEIALNDREITRHTENLKLSRVNYKNARLKFSKLHVTLYENILNETLTRLTVLKDAISLLGNNPDSLQIKIDSLETLLAER